MRAKGFSHREKPVGHHRSGCRISAIDAMGDFREIAGVKKNKLLIIISLMMGNFLKIYFCTFLLLVSLMEQGKVCGKARMPTG
jgi:hypothetical protein